MLGVPSCTGVSAQERSLAFPEQVKASLRFHSASNPNRLPVAPFNPMAWNVSSSRPKAGTDKFIFAPSDDVDDKLLIREPDPKIDYRLIVKDAITSPKK